MNQEQTLALWAKSQAAKKQTLEALENRANLEEERQENQKHAAKVAALKQQLDEAGERLCVKNPASSEETETPLDEFKNVLKGFKVLVAAGASSKAKARRKAADQAAVAVWNAWADSGEDDGSCDFSGVRFVSATDREEADTKATSGEIDLKLYVDRQVDFIGFKFPGAARFEKTVFETMAFFGDVEGGALFHGATFEQLAIFESITGLADFSNTCFEDQVSFRGDFIKDALFQGAAFGGSELNFRYFPCVFHGKALFDGAAFGRSGSDESHTETTDFSQATFFGPASFRSCRFNERGSFKEAKINSIIDFEEADFLGYPPAFEFGPEVQRDQVLGAGMLAPPVKMKISVFRDELAAAAGSLADIPTYDSFYIEACKRGKDLDITYHSDRFQTYSLWFKAFLPIDHILSWPEDHLPFDGYWDVEQWYIEEIIEKDGYVYICQGKSPETGNFEHCYRVPTKRYKAVWDDLIRRLQESREDESDAI